MRKLMIGTIAAAIGSAGWITAANAELLSATRPVIALLGGDLYVGSAVGHLSGAGTLAIHSQKNPALTCLGQFTSSAALGGSGQMLCSDGTTATFKFQRLSVFRGYGDGSTSRGSMTFSYGLTAEQAVSYLKLPEGKKLMGNGTELAMIDL